MRIAVFQPPYPAEETVASAEDCLRWMRMQLEGLRPGEQDLVLLPEYANAPGLGDRRQIRRFSECQGTAFLQAVAASAQRLGSLVALSALVPSGSHWYNRGLVFDAQGDVAFTYDKMHLTDAERGELGVTPGARLTVFEHAGVRLAFATCFDLYFPDHFSALAALRADLVLCPSYQRSESALRICLLAQTRALDSGAYLIRSSYSRGDPELGGHSLAATPAGVLLADAEAEPGVMAVELDPTCKFIKPASHGRADVEYRSLIESHRRPAAYRPHMESAIGRGLIAALSWDDIRRLDAGARLGEMWRGIRTPRLEEVLELVDGRIALNMHIKEAGPAGQLVRRVCDLLCEQALLGLAYIAGDAEAVLQAARDYIPEIPRACLVAHENPVRQIELAQQYTCQRIQFGRHVTAEHAHRAHEAGILCNMFWSDDPEDGMQYVRNGIDVILTNCAHVMIAGGFPALQGSPLRQ